MLQLNFGAFALHAALTAVFVELPGMLQEQSGLPLASHWKIYAPVLAASAVAMAPLLMLSARRHRIALLCAVALLAVACAGLARIAGSGALPAVLAALWVFFTAFNALEAMLPSRVSRLAPARAKGAAIGVYTTCQFLGMFAGGLCGGALSGRFGAGGVFWFCAALAAVWFAAAAAHKGSGEAGRARKFFRGRVRAERNSLLHWRRAMEARFVYSFSTTQEQKPWHEA